MAPTPDDFHHTITLDVRFGDLDALGHLNNAKTLTYMEHARIRYFGDVGLWDATPAGLGVIVARVTVDYRLPVFLGDRVTIATRISRLGTKSLAMDHVIRRQDGEIAATGTIILVAYDYPAGVSIPIPDAWREALAAFEPALQDGN